MENITCTFCGSVCDDVYLDSRTFKHKDLCPLGEAKFSKKKRIEYPSIEGKKVSYDEAIDKAVEILVEAKRPLLFGWSSTVNEAIRQGVILSEKVGGIYDQCSSVCHAPGTLALIEEGLPGGSLGQIKNRTDLTIMWGCNPVEAHPRHPTRYSVMAKGFLTKGRTDRKVVVVDVRKTVSALMATDYIIVEPGTDYLIFSALRAIVSGNEDVLPEKIGGVPKEKLIELANLMLNSKYITILFGLGLSHIRGHDRNIENIIKLVQLMNRHTRCILQPMRGHYNVVGAGEVAAWECGFEWAVDFSRGYPRFSPSEFTATEALLRRDVDAALIVSSDPAAHIPKAAVSQLKKIPVIQIDPFPNLTTLLSNVIIPCAITGLEAEGNSYRMDGVPVRVKKIVDSDFWSDEKILRKMVQKAQALRFGD